MRDGDLMITIDVPFLYIFYRAMFHCHILESDRELNRENHFK